MKKQLLFLVCASLASSSMLAAPARRNHNLKDNGLAAGLNMLCADAKKRKSMAPIVQKYYARVQQGQYDIPFEDLRALYEEMSTMMAQNCKHQI